MNNFTPEFTEQVKQAQSPEEIINIAKLHNIGLSPEEAQTYFKKLNSGTITDDELSDVSCGGCHSSDGRLVVSQLYVCDYFGKRGSRYYHSGSDANIAICDNCKYCTYEKGLWLCNNPKNNK